MTARAPSHEERAAFLKRFQRFGSEASVETYLALFHPEARLFDDGMERPLARTEIPAHIAGVLALVRGFRMRVERWRARGAVVFVEAHNAGVIAGRPLAWRAVYRLVLDGSLVRDGRRYFDRAPLLAALANAEERPPEAGDRLPPEPAAPAAAEAVLGSDETPAALVARWTEAWRTGRPEAIAELFREDATLSVPGLARPLGRGEIAGHLRRLAARLGGARLAPRAWAGDDALLFVEWEASRPDGPTAGGVERFDLAGGRILVARSYFDTTGPAFAP